jgi:hypothetical protein
LFPSYGDFNRCKNSIFILLYRKYVNHIHLTSFFYFPFLMSDLSSVWLVFHKIACICIGSIIYTWEKTCGLWLSQKG